MEKQNQTIEALTHDLIEQLELKSYSKDTLNNYRRILKKLALYMQHNAIPVFSSEVGNAFFKYYISTHEISVSFQKAINTVIGRLNDYSEGAKYYPQRKKPSVKLPKNYAVLLEDYLSFCEQNGNKKGTIKGKRNFCGDFLFYLMSLGCNSVGNVDASRICKACLMFDNKDAWTAIRMFLKYLYEERIVEYDYSIIVPHYARPFVIPTTYSVDEILRFENAIDRSSKIGIRDYAILLLATRLGMRSGDIARLTFNEIDFEGDLFA